MALFGFLIALVIAIPVGIVIGLSRFAFLSTKFTFDFFKVIPPIVIIPITILVFGPTQEMGTFLVVFALVFALTVSGIPTQFSSRPCAVTGWAAESRCSMPACRQLCPSSR